jgi:uncharacterized integral membrane protein
LRPSGSPSHHRRSKAEAGLLILGILISLFLLLTREPVEFWIFFLAIFLPLILLLAGGGLKE